MPDLLNEAAPAAANAPVMPEAGPTADPQGDPVPASSVLPEAAVEEFGAEPMPVESALEPIASRAGQVIDRWVAECIHNSPVSNATAAYNHLSQALVELKRRILKEF